ncbi:MAG: alpha/beta hydrolase [Pseudomonadota bacterium]
MNGGTQAFAEVGSGRAVVLLHGWPQTWYEWRHVAPLLSEERRVIMPDTRGLGASDHPEKNFEKRVIAEDVIALLDEIGEDSVDLVGHDWGGPIAFAMAMSAPDRVRSLAIVDVVIPGDGRKGGMAQGGRRWHHLFHATPSLPELLVCGRERAYLEWFFKEYSETFGAPDSTAVNEYLKHYSRSEVLHAGFEYYRAAKADARWNSEMLAKQGRLQMPVLGVSGGAGRGRGAETSESLHAVADNVQSHILPGCGHLVPEERPNELAGLLREFWSNSSQSSDRETREASATRQ